jgi:hypothetical protein
MVAITDEDEPKCYHTTVECCSAEMFVRALPFEILFHLSKSGSAVPSVKPFRSKKHLAKQLFSAAVDSPMEY